MSRGKKIKVKEHPSLKRRGVRPIYLYLFLLPNAFFLLLMGLDRIYPLPAEKPFSKIILARDSSLLATYLTTDDKWRMETRLQDVNPDLVKALIRKEDKYFYYHPGVNLLAGVRALWGNTTSGRRVSGASTITMQLARLMQPSRRTYGNKFLEMLRALQLEWHYPKDRILELYMSYLPYGGNVEGVKAASFLYFQRPPAKLSLAQNVLLTVVPNRPNSLRLDKFTDQAIRARNKWLIRFQTEKIFPDKLTASALDEPVEARRITPVPVAPHFSMYLRANVAGNEVRSTLSREMQAKAEMLLRNHVNRVKGRNVSNGALIVVDNRTMEVVAYCGSADFNDAAAYGQVNGARAARSPGSTLKPALYALAMDAGMITPKSLLYDIPTNFNGYVPENYSGKFLGPVTADYALVQSLNIPAIRLLQEYGLNRFVNFLSKEAQLRFVKGFKGDFGLSVILGGCGASLEELVRYYTAFARQGQLGRLHYTLPHPQEKGGRRIFSSEASWLIGDILSQNDRPDIPSFLVDESSLPKVAFKTGTSYGKKDAWAIGYSPNYTIGVWMGNFDGSGAAELSGGEMAVPLLFDLFNALNREGERGWFARPAGLENRRVCRESGMEAGSDCRSVFADNGIKNISNHQPCNLYQELYTDPQSTVQYCPACRPDGGFIKTAFPMYAPELVLWYKENGKGFTVPPPHNPNCEARLSSGGPNIISPSSAFEYFLDEDAPQNLMLQASSDPTVSKHFWYIDDKLFKEATAGQKLFFQPHPGMYRITCMDDKGRSSSVEFKVKKL